MTVLSLSLGTLRAEPQNIPKGEAKEVGNPPVRFQCYDLDSYKSLLKFDVEHTACLQTVDAKEKQRQNLMLQIGDLEEVLKAQSASIDVLKKDNNRLYGMWEEENRKRHLAENKPAYGSWLAWGTAGVFVVATAVLAGVVIAKD